MREEEEGEASRSTVENQQTLRRVRKRNFNPKPAAQGKKQSQL